MTRQQMIVEAAGAAWAILPERLAWMLAALRTDQNDTQSAIAAAAQVQPQAAGAIAVLPLYGVIAQRADAWSALFGGVSTVGFAQRFRAMVADPGVAAIVLDVDSPGGMVSGTDELSAEIYRARGSKPVVAVANSLMASAAYWIASAADEVVVTPTGEVGSIGVVTVHEDLSAMIESAGVRLTVMSAGKYKTEGNPYEPLGDEARAAIQGRLDEYYGMFVSAVARNRGVGVAAVRGGYGEGRVLGAKEAVAVGLADRVATLDGAIEGVARDLRRNRAARAEDVRTLDTRRRRLRASAR